METELEDIWAYKLSEALALTPSPLLRALLRDTAEGEWIDDGAVWDLPESLRLLVWAKLTPHLRVSREELELDRAQYYGGDSYDF